MEYMRIEGFLGRAITRLLNKAVESKIGFKPNIDVLNMNVEDGGASDECVVVTLKVGMTKEDFEKMIEEVTK